MNKGRKGLSLTVLVLLLSFQWVHAEELENYNVRFREPDSTCGVVRVKCDSRTSCDGIPTAQRLEFINEEGDTIRLNIAGREIGNDKRYIDIEVPGQYYEFLRTKRKEGFTLGRGITSVLPKSKKYKFCEFPLGYVFGGKAYEDVEALKRKNSYSEYFLLPR